MVDRVDEHSVVGVVGEVKDKGGGGREKET